MAFFKRQKLLKLPTNYNELQYDDKAIVREEYINLQKNRCYYCKEFLLGGVPSLKVRNKAVNKSLFPSGFFDYPLHLHHNHDTGMTIGVVHSYCNAVLWQYFGE